MFEGWHQRYKLYHDGCKRARAAARTGTKGPGGTSVSVEAPSAREDPEAVFEPRNISTSNRLSGICHRFLDEIRDNDADDIDWVCVDFREGNYLFLTNTPWSKTG